MTEPATESTSTVRTKGRFRRFIKARFGIFNVRDYGAKGDGVTDDTEAIITTARVAGAARFVLCDRVVFIPRGTHLVGPIPVPAGVYLEDE